MTNKQKNHEFVFYDHWKSTCLWQLLMKLCSLKIKYIFKNNLEKHLSLDHVADCTSEDGMDRIIGI